MGHILYDAYGSVLTSTIPATLTTVLVGAPDPDTGLVHLGNGRWYDPSMGRPLQPNPAGGPPTVPQALNRYVATPVGQPGVAEGAGSTPYTMAFWHQVPGTILGLAIDQAPAARVVGSQLLGQLEISYLPSAGFQGLISRVSLSGVGQQLTRLPLVGGKIAAYYASRYRQITVPVRLGQGAPSPTNWPRGAYEAARQQNKDTKISHFFTVAPKQDSGDQPSRHCTAARNVGGRRSRTLCFQRNRLPSRDLPTVLQ